MIVYGSTSVYRQLVAQCVGGSKALLLCCLKTSKLTDEQLLLKQHKPDWSQSSNGILYHTGFPVDILHTCIQDLPEEYYQ